MKTEIESAVIGKVKDAFKRIEFMQGRNHVTSFEAEIINICHHGLTLLESAQAKEKMQDVGFDIFKEIPGLKKVDPAILEPFKKEMEEKVIPEIVSMIKARNESRIAQETNWTMYEAWRKRAEQAEAELITFKAVQGKETVGGDTEVREAALQAAADVHGGYMNATKKRAVIAALNVIRAATQPRVDVVTVDDLEKILSMLYNTSWTKKDIRAHVQKKLDALKLLPAADDGRG